MRVTSRLDSACVYVCALLQRLGQLDRRTVGPSVCRSAPLSLSPTLSALKLLQELAQSDLLIQTDRVGLNYK